MKCKTCNADITFQEGSPQVLGFKIIIASPNCPEVFIPSSKFIQNEYKINRGIVLALRLLGVGLNGIVKFCAFMELPQPIFQSFYDKLVDMIPTTTATVQQASMKKDSQRAYLRQPAGNRWREGGHPQGWKAQTRREMADEMAW